MDRFGPKKYVWGRGSKVGYRSAGPLLRDTRLHCCPYMDRPRPFSLAHKREASGGLLSTKYSPQSVLERMRERARVNFCLLGKTEPFKRVLVD